MGSVAPQGLAAAAAGTAGASPGCVGMGGVEEGELLAAAAAVPATLAAAASRRFFGANIISSSTAAALRAGSSDTLSPSSPAPALADSSSELADDSSSENEPLSDALSLSLSSLLSRPSSVSARRANSAAALALDLVRRSLAAAAVSFLPDRLDRPRRLRRRLL